MTTQLQAIILKKLVSDEQYCRKVLPFIKSEYFDAEHRAVYSVILNFIAKYNKLPSKDSIEIEFSSSQDLKLNESQHAACSTIISDLANPVDVEPNWLLSTTEKWCKDRALYLAIMQSIQIIDGKSKDLTEIAIPDILQKALSINFDDSVGHDYLTDFLKRYDFYHRTEDKLAFDLDMFNTITKGGVPRKTLNIALAGTGVGKSLFMCHVAASALAQGKNVLYITLEMSEERIAERIDANLLNVQIDQLANLPKDIFTSKIRKLAGTTLGKLIIKEYPTASAHTGHFRALLNELKLKKDFVPDVIFIDYLNICSSARMKGVGGAINTYSFIKAIAEEIRGLAVEFNVPIFSATQTTRSGFASSDVELTDTSESFGLPATADLMFALIATEEMDRLGQIIVKQLKNRYNDPTTNKRFVIGIDRAKMRLFDVEAKAQNLSREPTVRTGSESTDDEPDFSRFH
jgi:replicative DNA helicase